MSSLAEDQELQGVPVTLKCAYLKLFSSSTVWELLEWKAEGGEGGGKWRGGRGEEGRREVDGRGRREVEQRGRGRREVEESRGGGKEGEEGSGGFYI